MLDIIPGATFRPIGANFTRNGMGQVRLYCPHVPVGNGSLFGEFNQPTKQASTHGWIGKEAGHEQYVSLRDKAWAVGWANGYTFSEELEGFPGEPMTDFQLHTAGASLAWARSEGAAIALAVTTDPAGSGVCPHNVLGGGHTCPGPGPRQDQYPAIVEIAFEIERGGITLPPIPPEDPLVTAADDIVKTLSTRIIEAKDALLTATLANKAQVYVIKECKDGAGTFYTAAENPLKAAALYLSTDHLATCRWIKSGPELDQLLAWYLNYAGPTYSVHGDGVHPFPMQRLPQLVGPAPILT